MFKLNQGHTVVVEEGSSGGEWQSILSGVIKIFGGWVLNIWGLGAKYLRGFGVEWQIFFRGWSRKLFWEGGMAKYFCKWDGKMYFGWVGKILGG